jgi:hypothetical protein
MPYIIRRLGGSHNYRIINADTGKVKAKDITALKAIRMLNLLHYKERLKNAK